MKAQDVRQSIEVLSGSAMPGHDQQWGGGNDRVSHRGANGVSHGSGTREAGNGGGREWEAMEVMTEAVRAAGEQGCR